MISVHFFVGGVVMERVDLDASTNYLLRPTADLRSLRIYSEFTNVLERVTEQS